MLPRTLLQTFAIMACLAAAVAGCADHSKLNRPSVQQLYQDAISVARISDTSGPTMQATDRLSSHGTELPPDSIADSFANEVQTISDSNQSSDDISAAESLVIPIGGQEEIPATDPELAASTLINEVFVQTDLREAIDILTQTTGDTVIIDDTVGGVVSVQITNATFEEALEKLLLPLGFVYIVQDGTYLVAPPDPDSPLFSYVAVRSQYEPRYHLASKLVELLPARFSDFYQLSDERNLIVLDAPKTIGDEMLLRLQELDTPVQQVVLEAIVCVTAPDSEFRFGMDWNHVVAINSADQVNLGMNGLAISASASPYGVRNAFDDFAVTSAFVQLLSQEGYVTIRAAPRVTAKDGEKASITISRETFFSLQPTSSNVLFRQDVQQVDAGISLIITPKIRGDMVSVEIERAEVSEDIRTSDPRPELTSNPYPIINRRQVSTKVDVRDGHTIVIGGLVQRQTVDRVNRVPFLGSIPGVGHFFRTIEKQEQDAEVAIFISPRIVPLDEQ